MDPMKKLNFQPMGSAVTFDPVALAKMRCDTYNTTRGTREGYDCPDCLNRGGFLRYREDGSTYYEDCRCMEIRRSLGRLAASGLTKIVEQKTFSTFLDRDPWQHAIKKGAMDFASDPKGWFLICGQSGSGKTHLCTAICRERIYAGVSVRYMPWRDEIVRLKALSMETTERDKVIGAFKDCGLLYIDDLFKTGANADGSSRPSSADISIAFEILNYRYNNKLCTIISTEKTPDELIQIDEALGGRISEMAGSHIYNIKRNSQRNWRLKSVQNL